MPETQAFRRAADVLQRIVETKRSEVDRLERDRDRLSRQAAEAPRPRDVRGALARAGDVSVIAEVKRRSPGAGEIRPGLDPATLAEGYALAGAAAVSVLTDREYFGGSLDDLGRVRGAVELPLLRKDFILDEVQVAEARAAGADAILLIVRILDDETLVRLSESARAHGLTALVEVHDEAELERALEAGATVVGVNNRDLATFTTDLAVTTRLIANVPPEVIVVSESGIRSRADVERLGRHGVDAVLVGESLLRAPDPGKAVAELVGCAKVGRGSGRGPATTDGASDA